ncbi:MAG: HDIG domain-containing protein, partial [Deltaproteobacteria bacterium]|nr:HDIG domain-containing protein [Deltaproteobacteria bacterium]
MVDAPGIDVVVVHLVNHPVHYLELREVPGCLLAGGQGPRRGVEVDLQAVFNRPTKGNGERRKHDDQTKQGLPESSHSIFGGARRGGRPLSVTSLASQANCARSICKELRNSGERAWVVGGCVRDTLRGERVNDWDVATTALPEKVKRIFHKVIPTGIDHGTVTVLWKGEAYEVTTLRGEGTYTDGRRPDSVVFVEDIDRDLARRDFTVNAIAYDPVDGHIADPFDGLGDMRSKVLRAVGDPNERFQEDGLRILRGARFVATLGFELEEATEAAFRGALNTLQKVSPERVRDEWMKAMKANTPSRAFEVMRRTGILEVTYPELLEQVGCEQNQWHAYDVWGHTMRVLDESVGGPIERIAALLHDVAKPRTRAKSDKTNDWTFYHHEKVGADMAERWLREYRFSNQER